MRTYDAIHQCTLAISCSMRPSADIEYTGKGPFKKGTPVRGKAKEPTKTVKKRSNVIIVKSCLKYIKKSNF